MNILFVSSEVAPFAKTGGLGDVGAALPRALSHHGYEVRVVLPLYRRVREGKHELKKVLGPIDVQLGPRRIRFTTLEGKLPGCDVPVYFVDCPGLYDRPNIYGSAPDEHVRFALLSWASLLIAQHLQFKPDIVHANDWQTALLPLLLRTAFGWDRMFHDARSVLTIHNIGHQGTFGSHALAEIGLANEWDRFHQEQLQGDRLSLPSSAPVFGAVLRRRSPAPFAGDVLRRRFSSAFIVSVHRRRSSTRPSSTRRSSTRRSSMRRPSSSWWRPPSPLAAPGPAAGPTSLRSCKRRPSWPGAGRSPPGHRRPSTTSGDRADC